MAACCIVYTTDRTYLLPSLVSAIQARHHAPVEAADVAIFGFDIDPCVEAEFSEICSAEGIRLQLVQADVLEGAPAMMARLFLDQFMPAHYKHFLYVDGDTQIVSNLEPLLRTSVPAGKFLAANDPMTFLLSDGASAGARFASHIAAIGLSPSQAEFYFNTGVLRINRDGWDEIGRSAWHLARRRRSVFRFPDQDPLNVVGADCHVPMSLGWNFPIFMCNARVEASIRPAIYHFMSSPKPWQGAFMPWGAAAAKPYRDIVLKYPALQRYLPAFSPGRRLRYHVQQRYKRTTEMLTWGFSTRRRRILDYEASVITAAA